MNSVAHILNRRALYVAAASILTWVLLIVGALVLPLESDGEPMPMMAFLCFLGACCGGPVVLSSFLWFWLCGELLAPDRSECDIKKKWARLATAEIAAIGILPSAIASFALLSSVEKL